VTFAKADILQTKVEASAGGVVFMAQIEAHSSTKTGESDEAQAHDLQVLAPDTAHQGSMARAFSGHMVYTAAPWPSARLDVYIPHFLKGCA